MCDIFGEAKRRLAREIDSNPALLSKPIAADPLFASHTTSHGAGSKSLPRRQDLKPILEPDLKVPRCAHFLERDRSCSANQFYHPAQACHRATYSLPDPNKQPAASLIYLTML